MTSHDVVARIRRVAGQKSVGHAGTLDPLATGVLVLLLGRATGLSNYATASRKLYAAEIAFGVESDTDDAEGSIARTAPAPDLTLGKLAARLTKMTGEIMQVPPRYSAVKQAGQKAYAAARRGKEMELAARPVTIFGIDILSWQTPRLRLLVATGPGTYIRSLARDAGRLLDSAAYLQALVRLSSSGLTHGNGVELEALTRESLAAHLLPADVVVQSFPSLILSEVETKRARHGGTVAGVIQNASHSSSTESGKEGGGPGPGVSPEIARLYGYDGTFIGLARPAGAGWQPVRVLDPA